MGSPKAENLSPPGTRTRMALLVEGYSATVWQAKSLNAAALVAYQVEQVERAERERAGGLP